MVFEYMHIHAVAIFNLQKISSESFIHDPSIKLPATAKSLLLRRHDLRRRKVDVHFLRQQHRTSPKGPRI